MMYELPIVQDIDESPQKSISLFCHSPGILNKRIKRKILECNKLLTLLLKSHFRVQLNHLGLHFTRGKFPTSIFPIPDPKKKFVLPP